MRHFAQYRLLVSRVTSGVRRPCQWLPRSRKRIAVQLLNKVLVLEASPFRGYYPLALYVGAPGAEVLSHTFPALESAVMKRRSLGLTTDMAMPQLSADTAVLKKLPRLMEFLTHTRYDDDTPRQPGTMWLKVDTLAFIVTLLDPDACARISVRGVTVDDALALAEKLLGVVDAPWEVDRYAAERSAKKKKK